MNKTLKAFVAPVVLMFLFALSLRGDEPPPVKGFVPDPPVVKGFKSEPPSGITDQFRGTDGILYGKFPDGTYREVPGQQPVTKVAPEVAPPKGNTFQSGGYNPSHTCPTCGYTSPAGTGTWIIRGYNANGTHRHQCPIDGTVWSH